VLFLALARIAAGVSGPASANPPYHFLRAEAGLVERALGETGADRVPAGPSILAYSQAWAEAVGRWIDRVLSLHGDVWSGFVLALQILGLVLVAVAAGLLGAAIWRLVRKKLQPQEDTLRQVHDREAGDSAVPLSAEEWKHEIDRRLSVGDLAGSLEALWWWMARSVGGTEVDASWTSRQIVRSFRRQDLAADLARLDRMIYGARRPAVPEIRGLFSRLADALP
jgi:hypothetical protein